MTRSIRLVWLAASMTVVAGFAAAQDRRQEGAAGRMLVGAGSTFIAPLIDRWKEAHAGLDRETRMTYEAVGSGEGVRRFVAERVDFAASDGGMTDGQIAAVKRGVRFIPATIGSVVLAYNIKGVRDALRLSRDVYVDIFSGKIKYWDDSRIKADNPELALPHQSIALVVRQDSSGTTFAFSKHLSAIDREWQRARGASTLIDWPHNAMRARGNESVASRIRISDGAIGYVEYGFAQRLGLPMAALQNRAGQFVAPNAATIAKVFEDSIDAMPADLRLFIPDPPGNEVYPIATYSWLILYGRYQDAGVGTALKTFVRYGLTSGQAHATELGYVPLPELVANLSLNALRTVETVEEN